MTRSRMSSVNRRTVFRRFSNNDDNEDDENNTPHTVTTTPTQGFHLLHTFEYRLWLEVEHVDSGTSWSDFYLSHR
jgi:hypothetical protein